MKITISQFANQDGGSNAGFIFVGPEMGFYFYPASKRSYTMSRSILSTYFGRFVLTLTK